MKYIVYCTTNTINNKIYVGVHLTEDPNVFDGYIGNSINVFKSNSCLNHSNIPFHNAVKKYGYTAFKRLVLLVFDNVLEALKLEAYIVNEEFIARDDTYNIVLGGGNPQIILRKYISIIYLDSLLKSGAVLNKLLLNSNVVAILLALQQTTKELLVIAYGHSKN